MYVVFSFLCECFLEGGAGEPFSPKKVPPHSLKNNLKKRKSGFGLQIRFLRWLEIKHLS